jgi:NAD+ synthase
MGNYMEKFNARNVSNDIIDWIKNFFDWNGKGCNAIVGISGGKDSSIVAALCVEALGRDRVIGVLMPNDTQSDIEVARDLVNFLDIKSVEVNIGTTYDSLIKSIKYSVTNSDLIYFSTDSANNFEPSQKTKINLPARLRMSTLYAIAQSFNGRVANTCNLSEDWVGYATRYGDAAGDFSPLSHLTVTEVKEIGRLFLPEKFVDKIPTDGLCGFADEENLGFSYDILDKYIRTGEIKDLKIKEKIDDLHFKNNFKLNLMPSFCYFYE